MLGVVNMVNLHRLDSSAQMLISDAKLGSLLAYGLGHVNSPLRPPYQVIFLFCGALTVGFSAVML